MKGTSVAATPGRYDGAQ